MKGLLQKFITFGVAIYIYKNKILQECINLELIIGDNICNFIRIYRSPSQTHDDLIKSQTPYK